MFENEGLTALMAVMWVLMIIAGVIAYLNHKGHQRDRERSRNRPWRVLDAKTPLTSLRLLVQRKALGAHAAFPHVRARKKPAY